MASITGAHCLYFGFVEASEGVFWISFYIHTSLHTCYIFEGFISLTYNNHGRVLETLRSGRKGEIWMRRGGKGRTEIKETREEYTRGREARNGRPLNI